MTLLVRLLLLVGLIWSLPPRAEVAHFPPRPQAFVSPRDISLEEGPLTIYGATDLDFMRPLLEAFQQRHPLIDLSYHQLGSTELYERFVREADGGAPTADVVLSSAMDLQIKLANDGYAQPYTPPAALPAWSRWRDEVFGFTHEPAVIVYNRALVPADEVPRSRRELLRLLEARREHYAGRVGTYDPERSGVGFLFTSHDAELSPDFRRLAAGLGAAEVQLFGSSAAMLERVADARLLLAYNVLGSYAQAWAEREPAIGIVLPRDYTLVMTRLVLIPRAAPQPRLARLFLDFLLGEDGQRVVAGPAHLYAIHPGVDGELTARRLRALLGPALQPIQVNPSLLVYLDQAKRRRFLQQWRQALTGPRD